MKKLLSLLRWPAAGYRDVFAEFAVLMVFVIADQLAAEKKSVAHDGGRPGPATGAFEEQLP